MASAPSGTAVSVEEYLKNCDKPAHEYVDGFMVQKAVPDRLHSLLQKLLLLALATIDAAHGFDARPELHLRIGPRRFRVPDVCGIRPGAGDPRYVDEANPPLFTIEIASQGEPWTELRAKVSDHLSMGVDTVIIADPYNRTVTVATQTQALHELTPPLIVRIRSDARTLEINFDELYRKCD